MNFYLATFKICGVTPPPVFQTEFRLSGYFRNGHTFFSFINNGTDTIETTGRSPFPPLHSPAPFLFFTHSADNPCQNPIEYGQEINGIFSLSSGAGSRRGRKARWTSRRRTKNEFMKPAGVNANCPPRCFWHPSSRKFVLVFGRAFALN